MSSAGTLDYASPVDVLPRSARPLGLLWMLYGVAVVGLGVAIATITDQIGRRSDADAYEFLGAAGLIYLGAISAFGLWLLTLTVQRLALKRSDAVVGSDARGR